MKKAGLHISAEATAVQGPRGLSIKEFKFKETLSNGDNVYQVILENNTVIGELTAKKGDKGLKGDTGEDGNGIIDIKVVEKVDKTNNWEISYTNGKKDYISVQDGDSAFEVAVDNGFTWEWTGEGEEPLDYGVKKWLESLIGKGLEFEWKGTELGIRVEGETEYKYVNLKGQTGDRGPQGATGKNLEFTWRGTELGVRVQGESNYQYVDLKGDNGEVGEIKFENIINNWKIATKYIGDTNTSTDFNSITANGTYYSNVYNSLFTNGFLGTNQQAYPEFKLIVIGENNDGVPVLKSQLVITRDDNIYLRSCTAWQAPWTWSEWKKIARMSDVDEKFNEELNKKLDKSTVSSEYDNAAKIESKIKEAKKTADGKVSKSGDTMSGSLIVKDSQDPFTALYTRDMLVGGFARGYKVSIDGKSVAEFGVRGNSGVEEYVYIGSSWENVRLLLHSNGKSQLKANNLKTTNKEVVEAINELNNNKLNKGAVSSDYDTAKKIEDKIKGIDEKFKNFCPYAVGDVYVTTSTTNPATRWTGTTWQKIEGRFLLGTSGSGASKATGGSNSKTIAQANLPNVKLTVNSFSVTSKDTFIESLRGVLGSPSSNRGPISMPKIGENNTKLRTGASNGSDEGIFIKQNQSSEISGTVSPQTSALGSGSALNITPAYYTCHMWLRLT